MLATDIEFFFMIGQFTVQGQMGGVKQEMLVSYLSVLNDACMFVLRV